MKKIITFFAALIFAVAAHADVLGEYSFDGTLGDKIPVTLKFAVNGKAGILLMSDPGSLNYLINKGMLCTSLCGMRKHCDDGFCTNKGLKALGACIGNGRKFFGTGILVETAVGKQEGSVLTVFAIGHIQDKETGYQLDAGSRTKDLE